MSKKAPKIAQLTKDFEGHPRYASHYLGYFQCFNAQFYYEAHDVLEFLWLDIRGSRKGYFYQGLIQLAGGFVHMQKERLAPASRLLALALKNFAPLTSDYEGLSLPSVITLAESYKKNLEASDFKKNPYSTSDPPLLKMPQ